MLDNRYFECYEIEEEVVICHHCDNECDENDCYTDRFDNIYCSLECAIEYNEIREV